MKETITEYGVRILEALKQKNQKQVWLRDVTGLSANAISQYITEKRIPEPTALYRIAKALDVTMEWILTGESNTTIENSKEYTSREVDMVSLYRLLPEQEQKEILTYTKYRLSEYEKTTSSDSPSNANETA